MAKHSKKYREAAERIDRNNLYTPEEAIALLKSMPAYNFDQTVEAVLRLNVDPRKADQLVRGSVNLPNGTGKTAKVLVFARGPKATEALDRLNVEDLDANAIIRLIVEGAKLERGNLLEEAGFLQPTGTPARSGQQGAADGGIDWSKLTDADLRKLASMDGGDDDEEE